jgi:hypothetical protein
MNVRCDTCGWNGEGEHVMEPGDCHRIDYLQYEGPEK